MSEHIQSVLLLPAYPSDYNKAQALIGNLRGIDITATLGDMPWQLKPYPFTDLLGDAPKYAQTYVRKLRPMMAGVDALLVVNEMSEIRPGYRWYHGVGEIALNPLEHNIRQGTDRRAFLLHAPKLEHDRGAPVPGDVKSRQDRLARLKWTSLNGDFRRIKRATK